MSAGKSVVQKLWVSSKPIDLCGKRPGRSRYVFSCPKQDLNSLLSAVVVGIRIFGKARQAVLSEVVKLEQSQLQAIEGQQSFVVEETSFQSSPIVPVDRLSKHTKDHRIPTQGLLRCGGAFKSGKPPFNNTCGYTGVEDNGKSRASRGALAKLLPLDLLFSMAICVVGEPTGAKSNQAGKHCREPVSDVSAFNALEGYLAPCKQERCQYDPESERNQARYGRVSLAQAITSCIHASPSRLRMNWGILA
ncbi:hypothetical protein JY458_01175 [Stenotrophomonas maltophilia]|nr:hypothetical protein [Stenotrophomonas maltophilia]